MFAMLVGMVTGVMAMAGIIIEKIIIAAALFFVARRQGMNAPNWLIAGVLLDFWTVLVYIIVRIKIAKQKCASCGERVGKAAVYCSNCGEKVKKIDDGAIAKKFVLGVVISIAVFSVIGVIWTLIFS